MSKTLGVSNSLSAQSTHEARAGRLPKGRRIAPLFVALALAPSAWAQTSAPSVTNQAQPTNAPAPQPAAPPAAPALNAEATGAVVTEGSTTPTVAAPEAPSVPATPPPAAGAAVPASTALPAIPARSETADRAPSSDCKQEWARDGFYLRVVSSTGYVGFNGTGPAGKPSISGLGNGTVFAIGGSLAKGLVLAGTLQASQVSGEFKGGPYHGATFAGPNREIPLNQDANAAFSQFGALIDWYPTQSGFHVALGGGLNWIALRLQADGETLVGGGAAGTLLVGYDWPISRTFALGINLMGSATNRITLKYDGERTSGYELSGKSVGIGGSFLYF